MSDSAQVSAAGTAMDPGLAEVFDPAALAARLAEARARRAEALARRAAGSAPSTDRGTSGARVRTVDMAAVGAPAAREAAQAARPIGLVVSPRSPAPAAPRAAVPTLAPVAPTRVEAHRGGATMPERLAAAVARPAAATIPTAPPAAAAAPWHRQPLVVLGFGLAAGAAVTVAALMSAGRPDAPTQAPRAETEAPAAAPVVVASRPELHFVMPAAQTAGSAPGIGYGLAAGSVTTVADAMPEAPREVPLAIAAARAVPPAPTGDARPQAGLGADLPPATLVAVAPLPALVLDEVASPRPPAEIALRDPDEPAFPAGPAPDAVHAAPTLPRIVVAGVPGREAPTLLAVPMAPPAPAETAARQPALAPVPEVAPSNATPRPVLPRLVATTLLAAVADDAGPALPLGEDTSTPRLRYAAALPDLGPATALAWPGDLPSAPMATYALLDTDEAPPGASERTRPAATAAAGERRVGELQVERQTQRQTQRQTPRQPQGQTPRQAGREATPDQQAIVQAVTRAHLERAVEDMLRDRLLAD